MEYGWVTGLLLSFLILVSVWGVVLWTVRRSAGSPSSAGEEPEFYGASRYYYFGVGPQTILSGKPRLARVLVGEPADSEEIADRVRERLALHGQLDASTIGVSAREGEVTLTGIVSGEETRRLAQEIAESSPGVATVRNQLLSREQDEWARAS